MSTNLVFLFFLLCQILRSSSQILNFTYNGFHPPADISLQGIATLTPNGLLKLTNTSVQRTGHAFYTQPIRFKDSPNGTVLSDSYNNGCYNLRYADFIQTNKKIVLGGSISHISSFGGRQYEITILVWKDHIHGNWWLSLGPNNLLVGYWPRELSTTLADHAMITQWGGEILNSQKFSRHIKTQMRCGHFSNEGFRKSSYFRNLKIIDNNNSLQPVQNLEKIVTNLESYNIKDIYTDEWKTHFFYGGPGFSPTESRTVPLALGSSFIYLLFSIFLIV